MRLRQSIVLLGTMMIFSVNIHAQWKSLFNGKDLSGWNQKNGKAIYKVENGEIVGTTVANTPNSFLCTNEEYGDFIFEVTLKKVEKPGANKESNQAMPAGHPPMNGSRPKMAWPHS